MQLAGFSTCVTTHVLPSSGSPASPPKYPLVTNSRSIPPSSQTPASHVRLVVNIGTSCVHGPRSVGALSSSSCPPRLHGPHGEGVHGPLAAVAAFAQRCVGPRCSSRSGLAGCCSSSCTAARRRPRGAAWRRMPSGSRRERRTARRSSACCYRWAARRFLGCGPRSSSSPRRPPRGTRPPAAASTAAVAAMAAGRRPSRYSRRSSTTSTTCRRRRVRSPSAGAQDRMAARGRSRAGRGTRAFTTRSCQPRSC